MRALAAKLAVASCLAASVGIVGASTPGTAAVRPRVVVPAAAVHGPGFRPLAAVPLRIGLEFLVPPRDPAALARFIASVSTPGTPLFHHYLAKGQFGTRFGAAPSTLASVRAYLVAHRLTAVSVSADRLFVRATGTVGVVDALLHTKIGQYLYMGRRVYANTTSAVLPAALARSVRTVIGLNDVPKERTNFSLRAHRRARATGCDGQTAGVNATTGPFTIAQVGAAYKYDAFASHGDLGQGQTIAVFELTDLLSSDVNYYLTCDHLSTEVSTVRIDGGNGLNFSAEVEAALDVEIVATIAPAAKVVVYDGPNAQAGALDTYQRIATDDTAQTVSTSWGFCERADAAAVTAEAAIFSEMAAQGQTVVAAAGDSGASDCLGYFATHTNPLAGAIGVDDPASQPYVTAVGGTTISNAALIGSSAQAETVWDTKDVAGGGGGVSALWPRPSYQDGVAGTSAAGRSVPDLSIDADPASGYMIYTVAAGGWTPVGGTSCGAPMIAALFALANQYNSTRLGFVNPLLYQVGAQHPGVNFNDVTSGNNETYGVTGYGTAAAGYDDASGWGSPLATSFLGGDI